MEMNLVLLLSKADYSLESEFLSGFEPASLRTWIEHFTTVLTSRNEL